MARPIVLSNGELHVGINMYGLVHDFYYPYVGHENHTLGKGLRHRIGVWIDGGLSWIDDGSWQISHEYPHDALIGHTVAYNAELQLSLELDDAVDSDVSAFMRSIHIVNHLDQSREVRLFTHQAFVVGDSRGNTDTAVYMPDSDAVMHYRGRRVFIISGESDTGKFDQYSVGLFGIEGREGTWRDAEDGELGMCNVEHGRVDSILRFRLEIGAHDSTRVRYWIAAGTSLREALYVHRKLTEEGVSRRLEVTASWWHEWLRPTLAAAKDLPYERRRMFIVSAMILRAHMDKRGGIIASTDTAALNYDRDAYAYSWPRDGAYVLWPLIRLGYKDEVLRFFDFCRRGMHPKGYLAHKYRTDGALGSSWHPYLHADGSVAPPIQEDETASVLFIFAQYYHMHPDASLLKEYYKSFVKPMAEFLASYVDLSTHLPRPSYDLWEEVYQTTTYTTAVTHAALFAAADLAEIVEDQDSAVAWRAVADDMYEAAQKLLYNKERGAFIKGRKVIDGQEIADTTIDISSIFGSFMYGLFGVDSPEVRSSVAAALERFDQESRVGLPRYENDSYRREAGELMSNYWHVTTLWYAQYCLEIGNTDEAQRIIEWVEAHAFPSGVLSEQIFPSTGLSAPIAPLAWSHAEYMTTLLDVMNDKAET